MKWAGKHIAADDVPPVCWLDEQLKTSPITGSLMKIVSEVRVYRAGHIQGTA